MQFSEELISAYLDGELESEQRSAVERAISENDELRQFVDESRLLRAELKSMPRFSLGDDFARRVMQNAQRRLEANPAPPAASDTTPTNSATTRNFTAIAGVIAAIAAVLVLAALLTRDGDRPVAVGTQTAPAESAAGAVARDEALEAPMDDRVADQPAISADEPLAPAPVAVQRQLDLPTAPAEPARTAAKAHPLAEAPQVEAEAAVTAAAPDAEVNRASRPLLQNGLADSKQVQRADKTIVVMVTEKELRSFNRFLTAQDVHWPSEDEQVPGSSRLAAGNAQNRLADDTAYLVEVSSPRASELLRAAQDSGSFEINVLSQAARRKLVPAAEARNQIAASPPAPSAAPVPAQPLAVERRPEAKSFGADLSRRSRQQADSPEPEGRPVDKANEVERATTELKRQAPALARRMSSKQAGALLEQIDGATRPSKEDADHVAAFEPTTRILFLVQGAVPAGVGTEAAAAEAASALQEATPQD